MDVATGITPCKDVPRLVTTANDDPPLVPIPLFPAPVAVLCTVYGTAEIILFNEVLAVAACRVKIPAPPLVAAPGPETEIRAIKS